MLQFLCTQLLGKLLAPYRGKRNESGYITHVLKKVAELYNKTELEIANITTNNATQLFNI